MKSMPKKALRSEPVYEAPALSKGLEILELLGTSALPMSPSEIARALARSPNELFRMIAVLERHGYLRRDAQGACALSLKLFSLAQAVRPLPALLEAARGPMRQFAEQTGESCHLGILDGDRYVVVAQAEGPSVVRLAFTVGASFDPLRIASGRLLVASEPDQARRQARAATCPCWADLSTAQQAEIRAELDQLSIQRVSLAQDETLRGIHDTVVPVMGQIGVIAALACAQLSSAQMLPRARLVAALQKAASRITHDLGGAAQEPR
jgi:DNA-binding IclR family transcriptional regulator